MKKLIVCLAILSVASYAQAADVLIGSWENATNEGWCDHTQMESHGWANIYVDDPLVMPSVYEFSYDWASDGFVSLKTNVTTWGWKMRTDVHTELYNHSKLEFDVFAVAQPGSSATWAQVDQIAYSCQTNGWVSITGSQFSFGVGSGMHCVLDYTQLNDPSKTSPTDGYGSFVFALNAGGPVYFYLDNVKLTGAPIPEPATIGLLGLGGLALLRRRK